MEPRSGATPMLRNLRLPQAHRRRGAIPAFAPDPLDRVRRERSDRSPAWPISQRRAFTPAEAQGAGGMLFAFVKSS